jgi:hypothetical protein
MRFWALACRKNKNVKESKKNNLMEQAGFEAQK